MEDNSLSEYDDYVGGKKENKDGLLSPFTYLCFILILFLAGLLFLYSSSYDDALNAGLKHYTFLLRELIGVGGGLLCGVILSLLPKFIFRKLSFALCPLSSFFAIFFIFNKEALSESMKPFFGFLSLVSIIFLLSYILPRIQGEERKGIPMLFACFIISLVIIPSSLSYGMGYFLLAIIIIVFTLLRSEGRVGFTIFFAFCLIAAFILTLLLSPSAFSSFSSSSMRVNDSSFYSSSLYSSQVMIVRGGMFGKGIGNGEGKLGSIVDPKGELIFSTFAEEVGVMGIIVLLFCLFVVLIIGLRTSVRAKKREDLFSSYFSLGITLLLFFSSLLNILYALGLNPFEGVPLPFFTYSPLLEGEVVSLSILLYKNIYISRSNDER